MEVPNEDLHVSMARLEGKVDVLNGKLDARFDIVMQKIDAGDREVGQLVKAQESVTANHGDAIKELAKRVTNIAEVDNRERDRIRRDMTEAFDTHGKEIAALREFRARLAGAAVIGSMIGGGAIQFIVQSLT